MIWKDFSILGYCLINSGSLTNSQLFRMSRISAILLTNWDFQESVFPVSFCHLSGLAGYKWACVCCDKIVTIYLTENLKILLINTLVLNIWANFPVHWFSVTAGRLWQSKSFSLPSSISDWDVARDMSDSEHWRGMWCHLWGDLDQCDPFELELLI